MPESQAESDVRYDVELGIRETRRVMRKSDPVSLETVRVAEGYARHLRRQFSGRDLRLVAEVLITSSASLGTLMDTDLGIVALNVQGVAAVLILDADVSTPPVEPPEANDPVFWLGSDR